MKHIARVALLRVGVGAEALLGVLVVGHRSVLIVIDVRAPALADQAQVGVISTQLSIFVNSSQIFNL